MIYSMNSQAFDTAGKSDICMQEMSATMTNATATMLNKRSSSSSDGSHAPPKKKFKLEADAASVASSASSSSNSRDDEGEGEAARVTSTENTSGSSSPPVVAAAKSVAHTTVVTTGGRVIVPTFRKGGRIRLPDKLMEYLSKKVIPDTLWWQEDGDAFAFDTDFIQSKFLNKYFRGTKLTSFIRSLNRWGFRRVFYHSLPENALAFHNDLFRKEEPHLIGEMKMLSQTPSKAKQNNREESRSTAGSTGAASPLTVGDREQPPPALAVAYTQQSQIMQMQPQVQQQREQHLPTIINQLIGQNVPGILQQSQPVAIAQQPAPQLQQQTLLQDLVRQQPHLLQQLLVSQQQQQQQVQAQQLQQQQTQQAALQARLTQLQANQALSPTSASSLLGTPPAVLLARLAAASTTVPTPAPTPVVPTVPQLPSDLADLPMLINRLQRQQQHQQQHQQHQQQHQQQQQQSTPLADTAVLQLLLQQNGIQQPVVQPPPAPQQPDLAALVMRLLSRNNSASDPR